MNDMDPADARARGQAMRQTRLARARALRRRIIAGAVALFVASWLLITVVLATGHDPVLAKNAAASTTAATTSSGTSTTASSSSSSNDTSSSSNDGSSSNNVGSVTTSQS